MGSCAIRARGLAIIAAALAACLPAPASAATPPVVITTSFTPSSIRETTSSTLSFSIGNTSSAAVTAGFSDDLPAGIVVASPDHRDNGCGGNLTVAGDGSSVTLGAATLAANAVCLVSIDVVGTTLGDHSNSVKVTSNAGDGNTSTAELTVTPDAPYIATRFARTVLVGRATTAWTTVGTTTPLAFDLENLNSDSQLSGIGFTDTLPSGLVVATPNGLTGSCDGGTITAAPGSKVIRLSGATLTVAAPKCYFTINVTTTANGVQINSTGPVGSTEGGSGAAFSSTLSVFGPGPRVYFTNEDVPNVYGWLSFAKLDGSVATFLAVGGTNPPFYESVFQGLAIDSAAGKLYWAEEAGASLSAISLDGTGRGSLLTAAKHYDPIGVGFDSAAGRLYWSDGGFDTYHPPAISYASMQDGGGSALSTTGVTLSHPFGIAVDPGSGRVYWGGDHIYYAKLDGSGGGMLNTGTATVSDPRGIAVDPAGNRIYWTNYATNSISYANLTGGGAGNLTITGVTVAAPIGIAIDHAAGKIYWANHGANAIAYANLDGSDAHALATPGANPEGENASAPMYLALEEPPEGTVAPTITGSGTPGSVLSCSRGSWAADVPGAFLYRTPQSYGYQWTVDGTDIAGATASTFTAATTGGYACRVTASDAAGPASQTSAVHKVAKPSAISAPAISHASLTVARFRVGGQTMIRFTLSAPARISLTITHTLRGRRKGHRCVPATHKLRHAKRCMRTLTDGTLTRPLEPKGKDTVVFTGRLGAHVLRPGNYRLVLSASNAAGASKPVTLAFRIVP